MPSPTGAFIGLSLEDLQAELAIARARISGGDRTSLSGAAKSSGKNYSMSASDHVREVNYAINQINGSGLPMRTYFNANHTNR